MRARDGVLDIEDGSELPAERLAVAQPDPPFPVDEDADERAGAFRRDLNVDELDQLVLRYAVGKSRDFFRVDFQPVSIEKKSGLLPTSRKTLKQANYTLSRKETSRDFFPLQPPPVLLEAGDALLPEESLDPHQAIEARPGIAEVRGPDLHRRRSHQEKLERVRRVLDAADPDYRDPDGLRRLQHYAPGNRLGRRAGQA